MAGSETFLFTITPADDGEYERAEEALKSVGCYLSPTITRGTHCVTCSGVYAHVAADKAAEAADALKRARIQA